MDGIKYKMILDRLFQKAGIQLLNKSLKAASLRHEAISGNIANIGTPGYQRKEVGFEDKLQESMQAVHIRGKRTDSRHIELGISRFTEVTPQIVTDESNDSDNGINNVDIDMEMADLAKNQIHFTASATLMARKFRGLKSAIQGRSR